MLFIILILYKFELINVPILIIFVTIQTVFSTFSVPANNSLLPNIVTDEEILTAQSTINILTQFIQISAYVFAGFIIKLLGIGGAILIDAFTFIIATLIIKKVNINNTNIQKISSTKEFLNNVKDGFYFVLKNKNILAIMIVTFFSNMFASPVDSLMPAYFLQSKYTESAYSTFMLGITSGGIIGGICLSKIQKKLSNNKLLALGFAFGALGMVSLYYNISIIPYISAVLIGISYGVVSIMNAAILQLETPKDMVARTFSIFKCISYIAGPAGIVLAGYFGEIYEMRIVFVPFGLLLLVTSLLTIILIKPLIISENLN